MLKRIKKNVKDMAYDIILLLFTLIYVISMISCFWRVRKHHSYIKAEYE